MLQNIDHELFKIINRNWANPVLDAFFPFWTDIQKSPLFFIFLIVIMTTMVIKKKWKAIFVVVMSALGAFLADGINAKLLKPIFERARPVDTILRIPHQGSFSFPSSHAVDVFFLAMFLGLFFPKLRKTFFSISLLTALSRVYCGVHYPGDIIAGALVGMFLGFIFYKGIDLLMKTKLKALACLVILSFSHLSFAWEYKDPTEGKAFFPWIWEDQFKPTLKNAVDGPSLSILAAGAVSTVVVRQYDSKIYHFSASEGNLLMSHNTAESVGTLGNGMIGVTIAAAQIAFDQENGLKTGQALFLTTISHMSLAAIFQRERPNQKSDFLPFPSSFPSGHSSSAFALAGSMAYSYGWVGAIPGYLFASAISISRIKENRHWASDVVAGGFLGTYWARAAFKKHDLNKETFMVLPMPIFDGMMVSAVKDF